VTAAAAGVGVAPLLSATGELGEPGVADAVAAAAGVSDADGVAAAAGVSDADGVAAAAGVSDSDGEADAAEVSDSEGEADEAGDDPDELAVVVADGDASGVGVAIACGVRADTLRITTAATVHHGPHLKPARILEATWPSGPSSQNCDGHRARLFSLS